MAEQRAAKRVRLEVDAALLQQPQSRAGLRCWYRLPQGTCTIGDLVTKICGDLGLAASSQRTQPQVPAKPLVLLDGFQLQEAETVELVQDGDLLQLVVAPEQTPPPAAANGASAAQVPAHNPAAGAPMAASLQLPMDAAPVMPTGVDEAGAAADVAQHHTPLKAGSARSKLAAWTLAHPLSDADLPTTPNLLARLLDAMPLPSAVSDILQDCIYAVPDTGLFACGTGTGGVVQTACPRDDWVEFLVDEVVSSKCGISTALLCGLPDWGKSFSMPWVQLEAIRRLEGRLPGNPDGGSAAAAPTPAGGSAAAGAVDSVSARKAASLREWQDGFESWFGKRAILGGIGQGGDGPLAARWPFVMVVPCHCTQQPSLADMPVLLAAAAYLRLPVLFDRFLSWERLPTVLEEFLKDRPVRQPHLSLHPLQFILQDNNMDRVLELTSRDNALFRKPGLGVLGPLALPYPPVRLLAGLLKAYHPDKYPHNLLNVLGTTGRALHRYAVRPLTPPEELDICSMQADLVLKKEHKEVLELMRSSKPFSAPVRQAATLETGETRIQLLRLHKLGLVAKSAFSKDQPNEWELVDPVLITASNVNISYSSEQEHAVIFDSAPLRVMRSLTVQELLSSITGKLGLTGAYHLQRLQHQAMEVFYLMGIDRELVLLSFEHWAHSGDFIRKLQAKFHHTQLESVTQSIRCHNSCHFVQVTAQAPGVEAAAERFIWADSMSTATIKCHRFGFSDLVDPVAAEPLSMATPLCLAATAATAGL